MAATSCSGVVGALNGGGDAGTSDAGVADAGADGGQPPSGKYLFQQALLFQRAHARTVPHTYTNSLGQKVIVPANLATFDGLSGAGAHVVGSTYELLCASSRRPWSNLGGDWLDAAGTPQGATPFSRSVVLAGGSPAGMLTIDVSAAMKWAYQHRHWCAFFLKIAGSGRTTVTGVLNGARPAASLVLSRVGAPDQRLTCWYTASLRQSTATTNAQDDEIAFDPETPLVLEFFDADRPDLRLTSQGTVPTSASLELPYAAVAGISLQVEVFLVNPQVPTDLTPMPGLAAAYKLDEGLMANAAVAAALRVTDNDIMADVLDEERSGSFNHPWLPNMVAYGNRSEAVFDPYLWTTAPGQGDFAAVLAPTEAQRDVLFPRRVNSTRGTQLVGNVSRKMGTMPGDSIRVVHSDDALAIGRGFSPLAPGLGALEFMYGGGDIKNGQATFQSVTGTNTVDLDLWFREQHIGRVVDGYMRMYVLLGDGWDASEEGLAHQFYSTNLDASSLGKFPEQLGVDPRTATWRRLDRTGKFIGGIQQVTSGHTVYERYLDPLRIAGDARSTSTAGGGYSSSSGIHGYQGRWMFWQGYYKPGTPGPAVGGLALGVELYDFNGGGGVTIPSQNPVGWWDASWRSYATHQGGLGFLYPRKWYCVEMRWKMNSLKPYQIPPVGTHFLEGGHNVDGFIEWWVDGIRAAKTPMFAHRSSAAIVDWALQNSAGQPFDTVKGSPDRLRGISNVPPELFMGAASAVFNAYYGGRTFNDSNKFVYINGIVCSNGQYIGPMAGVSRENGGLGV